MLLHLPVLKNEIHFAHAHPKWSCVGCGDVQNENQFNFFAYFIPIGPCPIMTSSSDDVTCSRLNHTYLAIIYRSIFQVQL